MTPHQPNRGNRTMRTHGRLMSRSSMPQRWEPLESIDYIYNPQFAPDSTGPFKYDAYGQHRAERNSAPDTEEGMTGGPLFQGMQPDPSMPLMDSAPRHFSPTLKDWMPADPFAYVDGLNVYAAPVDEPVNPINPLGTRHLFSLAFPPP